MAVPDQVPFNQYTANGVSDTFAYTFKILSEDQLVVKLNGVVQTTGFTITGVGNDAGGSIVASGAPANGSLVELIRSTPATRSTDYAPNGDLREETLDADFDRAYMALQEMQEQVDRTMKLPQGATGSLDLDELTPDAYLKVNSTGTAITQVSVLEPSGTFAVSPFAETLLDDADAAAMRTTLDVYSEAEIIALFNIVAKGRLVDVQVFSATGAHTWTKTGALPASATVVVEVLGAGGGGGVAGQSSAGQLSAGLGGCSGSYIKAYALASNLAATEPVQVGTGGNAGSRSNAGTNNPTSGGKSYFGAVAYRLDSNDQATRGASNALTTGSTFAGPTDNALAILNGANPSISGAIWTVVHKESGAPPVVPIRLAADVCINPIGGRSALGGHSGVKSIVGGGTSGESTTAFASFPGCGGAASVHMGNTPALSATTYYASNGGDGLVIVYTYT